MKATLTAQAERLADTLGQMKLMFPEHWAELARNRDKVPLDPDYDEYLAMERRGDVLLVTLRADGELVGYFVGFKRWHLHYRTHMVVMGDIFWIHPAYRLNGGGAVLFDRVFKEARRLGASEVIAGSKMHKDVSAFLTYMGMEEFERYYSIWVGV